MLWFHYKSFVNALYVYIPSICLPLASHFGISLFLSKICFLNMTISLNRLIQNIFRHIRIFSFWLSFQTYCKVHFQGDSHQSNVMTILWALYVSYFILYWWCGLVTSLPLTHCCGFLRYFNNIWSFISSIVFVGLTLLAFSVHFLN